MPEGTDIRGELYEAGRDVGNTDQMVSEIESVLRNAPPGRCPLKIPYVPNHIWQVFWQKMRENTWIAENCCVVCFDTGQDGGRGVGIGLMQHRDVWLGEKARAHLRSDDVKVVSIEEYANAVTANEYIDMVRGEIRKAVKNAAKRRN
jgi:hypothetical protein